MLLQLEAELMAKEAQRPVAVTRKDNVNVRKNWKQMGMRESCSNPTAQHNWEPVQSEGRHKSELLEQ